jgi:hypothetical protein
MEIRGFRFAGIQQQYSSGVQLRETLVGQPKFDGLAGPMYDGDDMIRYEDWQVYERLSA